jgi:hypothetical protein
LGGLSIKPKKMIFKKFDKTEKKSGKLAEIAVSDLQTIHILYPGLFQMCVKAKMAAIFFTQCFHYYMKFPLNFHEEIFIKNIWFFRGFSYGFRFLP